VLDRRGGNGIVIGIVDDLEDPDGLGRVRVKYPYLGGQLSEWARLASLMAGKDRGAFIRPEKDDEVLIGFEQGDVRRPHVIGCLWNSVDTPPPDDGDAAANNWRFLRSRSGHVILLDDTSGAEKVEIVDKDEKRRIVVDAAGKAIQIICTEGDVAISATKGTVSVEAKEGSIKTSGALTIEATGVLTLKGSTVKINE
jgi:uncharacterized protein involved in type VI secretion and phage assembly